MSTIQSTVFMALQTNDDTRPIIEALQRDNPHAVVNRLPAMVKIDAPGRLVLKRSTVEEILGQAWDLQEINLNLISLSGNVEETEDEMILQWNR
ncbi:MmoB/DmpM family protein [Zoogloea sp.]|uniref:MmoB/DmpM family protein n=1 Tax=Zoogloea sp. TaxID=49181 RepID=UPI001AC702F5|nr:MmoB/DmpM family protein [Zoogloea sp.]MBN8283646.1 MmoB/DmpM family protein [Zoogloea sp.]